METNILAPRIANIYNQLNRLLHIANIGLAPDLQRFGGYLTILDAKDGKVLLVLACGEIPNDKMEKYLNLSMEKALRVFADKEHKTSWDTRDEANAKYPGAIKGVEAIYSFSGHQPDVDEASSISIFYLMEPAGEDYVCHPQDTQDLFNYYYQEVAKRNPFVKDFVRQTNFWNGNMCLRHLIT